MFDTLSVGFDGFRSCSGEMVRIHDRPKGRPILLGQKPGGWFGDWCISKLFLCLAGTLCCFAAWYFPVDPPSCSAPSAAPSTVLERRDLRSLRPEAALVVILEEFFVGPFLVAAGSALLAPRRHPVLGRACGRSTIMGVLEGSVMERMGWRWLDQLKRHMHAWS